MQGGAAQLADAAAAISMRPFWARKLRLAILQGTGVPQAVFLRISSLDWAAEAERELDQEHRQHWPVEQPTDAEQTSWEAALLDARLAEVGIKALKGLYEEALGICEELLTEYNSEAHRISCSISKIRVEGVKGLVLALKEDWKAAKDSLLRSVTEPCGNFFRDYVVGVFGEALGFLLTHEVVETNTNGSTDFRKPSHCESRYAFYPCLLLELEVLGEGEQHEQKILNAGHRQRMYLDCARLLSGWSESTCVCFNAYDMAAVAAIESKDMDSVRKILAESIQLAKSLLCMTHLESSLWKRLGHLEFEDHNYYLSLKSYSNALRSQLRIGAEVEGSEIQRIRESITLAAAQASVDFEVSVVKEWFPGPSPDAHPVDVMVHAFCVVAYLVYSDQNLRTPALQEVADVVDSNELNHREAVWINNCLGGLVKEYINLKEYGEAAKVHLIASKLVTNLEERLGILTFAAKYWYFAGELKKGLEIMREALDLSTGLDASQWKTRALLHIAVAAYVEKDGQMSKAVAIREAGWEICAGVGSYDYSDEDMAQGMAKLLFCYLIQTPGLQLANLSTLWMHILRSSRERPGVGKNGSF